MAARLERISKIRPLRALLAAGGLAVLLLIGVVASPASAQDYPPSTNPPTSVEVTEVSRTDTLPRTGSDNTEVLVLVGAGVLVAGAGLVVLGKRRADRSGASA